MSVKFFTSKYELVISRVSDLFGEGPDRHKSLAPRIPMSNQRKLRLSEHKDGVRGQHLSQSACQRRRFNLLEAPTFTFDWLASLVCWRFRRAKVRTDLFGRRYGD